MTCKQCGSELRQLLTTMYCPNEDHHTAGYVLQLRTGPPPMTCEDPDTGEVLASIPFTAWGVKITITAFLKVTGTAGHFRINRLNDCIYQGTVSEVGYGPGDLMMDSVYLKKDMQIFISLWVSQMGALDNPRMAELAFATPEEMQK